MIRYLARWLPALLLHPRVALLGYREGLDSMGMTYDDDPESPRSTAYDVGRTLRRKDTA
jgi:hypothetical protein